MEARESFLFKNGRFSYHVLTKEYRDQALVVLARSFSAEPGYDTSFIEYFEFVDLWIDHCVAKGMSVFALDEEACRIAGVFLVRDFNYIPEQLDEKYHANSTSPIVPWNRFATYVSDLATAKMPALHDGKAVDLWYVGVLSDYRSNGIVNNLIKAILPLARKSGYKYATIEAMHSYTSKAASLHDFHLLCEADSTKWLWNGKPICSIKDSPLAICKFCVKNL